MKKHKNFNWFLVAWLAVFFTAPIFAQDDLFYDPTSSTATTTIINDEYAGSNLTKTYTGDDYDGASYEDDDYAYEYSSRIRRFQRRGFANDYYDPFYTDMYFYDPFYAPGASIYVMQYNDYWRWRRWNRMNRFNNWGWNDPFYGGFGYNSWGWGRPGFGGWGAWNNVYVYNNFFYDPYWTWNGFNPYYCPSNVWVNNNYYYNNNNQNNGGGYQPQTYTGIRRGGTNINPGYAALPGNGRLKASETAPQSERAGQTNGRTITSDKEPVAVDRSTGRTSTPTPAAEAPTGRATREVGTERPSTRTESAPARRETEVSPRPRTERPATETRPERRNKEVLPTRSNDAQPTDSRPSRRSEDARPSRRSNENTTRESRPTRSFDTPTRSERSSSPSMDRGSSSGGRSTSPSSGGGRSSGGSSRGGRN